MEFVAQHLTKRVMGNCHVDSKPTMVKGNEWGVTKRRIASLLCSFSDEKKDSLAST